MCCPSPIDPDPGPLCFNYIIRPNHSLADPPGRLGGGGGLKRGGADCRRSRPGEGAGGGHPSRPARGYGAPPQKPALFALENPPKLRNESIITDPAFIFSMRRTTVHCIVYYEFLI